MKKLFLLTLISVAANSFCAEVKNNDGIDFNNWEKEFTVIGKIFYNKALECGTYFIKPDNSEMEYQISKEELNKLSGYKGKFTLKLVKTIGIPCSGIPVTIVKFEKTEEENESSCTIL